MSKSAQFNNDIVVPELITIHRVGFEPTTSVNLFQGSSL
jgi:hypothetical protein